MSTSTPCMFYLMLMKAHINLRQEPLTKILHTKTNFKKVGFSTMAFTDKILSWRFRHLNIVGCLLKRRPTKGRGGHGHPRTPLATPQHHHRILATLISVTFNYKAQAILRRRSMRRLFAVKMPLCKAKKKNTRQSSTKENVTKKKTTKQTSK